MAMPKAVYGATAFNQFSFKLRGQRWNPAEYHSPEFSIDVVNNNPRFVVWTRNPSEKEKLNDRGRPLATTPISAHMRWQDLMKFILLMERVCANPQPSVYTMSFKGSKFDANGNQIKGEFEIKCKLQFGRDADGVIYHKLFEKGREKPTFRYTDNFWVPVQEDANQDLSQADNSTLTAQSFWGVIKLAIGPVLTKYHVPEIKEQADQKATVTEASTTATAHNDSEGWD
jgi:hypothetical protein